jgi:hypothetical protein
LIFGQFVGDFTTPIVEAPIVGALPKASGISKNAGFLDNETKESAVAGVKVEKDKEQRVNMNELVFANNLFWMFVAMIVSRQNTFPGVSEEEFFNQVGATLAPVHGADFPFQRGSTCPLCMKVLRLFDPSNEDATEQLFVADAAPKKLPKLVEQARKGYVKHLINAHGYSSVERVKDETKKLYEEMEKKPASLEKDRCQGNDVKAGDKQNPMMMVSKKPEVASILVAWERLEEYSIAAVKGHDLLAGVLTCWNQKETKETIQDVEERVFHRLLYICARYSLKAFGAQFSRVDGTSVFVNTASASGKMTWTKVVADLHQLMMPFVPSTPLSRICHLILSDMDGKKFSNLDDVVNSVEPHFQVPDVDKFENHFRQWNDIATGSNGDDFAIAPVGEFGDVVGESAVVVDESAVVVDESAAVADKSAVANANYNSAPAVTPPLKEEEGLEEKMPQKDKGRGGPLKRSKTRVVKKVEEEELEEPEAEESKQKKKKAQETTGKAPRPAPLGALVDLAANYSGRPVTKAPLDKSALGAVKERKKGSSKQQTAKKRTTTARKRSEPEPEEGEHKEEEEDETKKSKPGKTKRSSARQKNQAAAKSKPTQKK